MDCSLITSTLLVATTILTRVIIHPPNFTATNSSLVYGNSVQKKIYFIIYPIFIILVSDIINHYIKQNTPIFSWSISVYNYGCYLLVSIITRLFTYKDNKVSLLKTPLLVLNSSLLFYLITNFGVYFQSYETRTIARVYIDGLPFLGWEVFGNLVYSFIFFFLHILMVEKYGVNQNQCSISDESENVTDENKDTLKSYLNECSENKETQINKV